MNINNFNYNSINIEPANILDIYYFSDDDLDWFQVVNLQDTDGFLSFMDDCARAYDFDTYERINEYFTKIFESDL